MNLGFTTIVVERTPVEIVEHNSRIGFNDGGYILVSILGQISDRMKSCLPQPEANGTFRFEQLGRINSVYQEWCKVRQDKCELVMENVQEFNLDRLSFRGIPS